jgi:hypothetical protein
MALSVSLGLECLSNEYSLLYLLSVVISYRVVQFGIDSRVQTYKILPFIYLAESTFAYLLLT